MIRKLKIKRKLFPDKVSRDEIKGIKTLKDFDDVYTSKAHGFNGAMDYYEKSSSRQFLNNITIPTLVINAQNDSFLSFKCYPVEAAKTNPFIHLEIPDYGGHVGFWGKDNIYYNEFRSLDFLSKYS